MIKKNLTESNKKESFFSKLQFETVDYAWVLSGTIMFYFFWTNLSAMLNSDISGLIYSIGYAIIVILMGFGQFEFIDIFKPCIIEQKNTNSSQLQKITKKNKGKRISFY
jgi:phosphatidylglycerophosphatase A